MKQPLFIVTGTSGSGKSTVIPELRKELNEYCILDIDYFESSDDWNIRKCNFIRIAHSIAESNRRTIICGTIVPENLKDCIEVEHFSDIYYISLDVNDSVIRNRLKLRDWDNNIINDYLNFAAWLRENKEKAFSPTLHEIKCSSLSPKQVALAIKEFVNSK
jgi:broad-specificity NMP kinase